MVGPRRDAQCQIGVHRLQAILTLGAEENIVVSKDQLILSAGIETF